MFARKDPSDIFGYKLYFLSSTFGGKYDHSSVTTPLSFLFLSILEDFIFYCIALQHSN